LNKLYPFFLIILVLAVLVVPTCSADGGVEEEEQATFSTLTVYVPPPPPPPPPPPSGPPGEPGRGDIMAELSITLMRTTYAPGETLRALVNVNNYIFTQNDVILRLNIMSDSEIHATIEKTTNIRPGMNQRIIEIEVPDVHPGDYLAQVEMVETNGDITWASAAFTVVSPPLVSTDRLILLAIFAIAIVAALVRRRRR